MDISVGFRGNFHEKYRGTIPTNKMILVLNSVPEVEGEKECRSKLYLSMLTHDNSMLYYQVVREWDWFLAETDVTSNPGFRGILRKNNSIITWYPTSTTTYPPYIHYKLQILALIQNEVQGYSWNQWQFSLFFHGFVHGHFRGFP